MSDAPKLTKKQKKAAAFRDRKAKGKGKQQLDDALEIPVAENQDLADLDDRPEPAIAVSVNPKSKRKSTAAEDDAAREGAGDTVPSVRPTGKRKRDDANVDVNSETAGHIEEASTPKASKRHKAKPIEDTAGGNHDATEGRRYILFLGNLKYTTTREAITAHFSSCPSAPSIRLLTPKPKSGSKFSPSVKSKGCAFLEFSDKASLQQGLRLHHSVLDGRQINVELTAGGGGKSESRVAKLKERNKELHAQRTKAVETRKKKKGEAPQEEDIATLTASKRFSATSGVEQAPTKQRTWTVGDQEEEETHRGGVKHAKKRGKRKSATAKSMASGMNAIPVG